MADRDLHNSGNQIAFRPTLPHGSVRSHIRHRHRWADPGTLNRNGFRCTLVDKSPALRSGGDVIDFWGLGYEIAERMGLLSKMTQLAITCRNCASSMIAASAFPDLAPAFSGS